MTVRTLLSSPAISLPAQNTELKIPTNALDLSYRRRQPNLKMNHYGLILEGLSYTIFKSPIHYSPKILILADHTGQLLQSPLPWFSSS